MHFTYRQKFNHIHPKGATFFITFRLAGSIPKSAIINLKSDFESELSSLNKIKILKEKNAAIFNLRKQYLVAYDNILDKIKSGPHYLSDNRILEIVKKEIHRHDGKLYNLLCYCIMSNHVHILMDTNINHDINEIDINTSFSSVHEIMKKIKGASARYINIAMNRKESVWAKESYDMYIRNEKMLNNVISYILNNPVKANQVKNWKDFRGNYYFGDA